MKLIFIYGPPASGKLTIAEVLSQQTNIPLFHNHLSRDLVKDIYKDKLNEHYDLVDQLRLDVVDYCSRNSTDLIFTYVYEGKDDDFNVKQFIEIVENNKGEVSFVELTAKREDLINRVNNDSRKKYKKLTDPLIMAKITEDMHRYSIPFVDSIKIDTSHSTPNEAAMLIVKELSLI
ncbi:MAG TPA: AAA family ATPase [Candidatus Limnocylindrales bacterium]|nr:AAA family ATPase [Candidatus Limnocylindrales bacterium]